MSSGKTASLFVAAAFAAVILASGCLSPQAKVCGSDESCFSQALSSCSPANAMTATKTAQIGNVTLRYSVNATIKGGVAGDCMVEEWISDVEMRGNLTEAPSRLLYILVQMTNYNMGCLAAGNEDLLSLGGMRQEIDGCNGTLKDLLVEVYAFMDGNHPSLWDRRISVVDSYCMAGGKVVAYVRNTGRADINLTKDIGLSDAAGNPVQAEWRDFTGNSTVDFIIPLQIAQFSNKAARTGVNGFSISLDGRAYNFTVDCQGG